MISYSGEIMQDETTLKLSGGLHGYGSEATITI